MITVVLHEKRVRTSEIFVSLKDMHHRLREGVCQGCIDEAEESEGWISMGEYDKVLRLMGTACGKKYSIRFEDAWWTDVL